MFESILVPVDLAEAELAKPALDVALRFASEHGSSVRLIHVVSTTPAMMAEYVPPDLENDSLRAAETGLADLAAGLSLPEERVSTIVRVGDFTHEIIDEAKKAGANLIVMASHQPSMSSYILGSNATAVVRQATCSVALCSTHCGLSQR